MKIYLTSLRVKLRNCNFSQISFVDSSLKSHDNSYFYLFLLVQEGLSRSNSILEQIYSIKICLLGEFTNFDIGYCIDNSRYNEYFSNDWYKFSSQLKSQELIVILIITINYFLNFIVCSLYKSLYRSPFFNNS